MNGFPFLLVVLFLAETLASQAPAMSTSTGKWAEGLSQEDLMQKDTVLVLNDEDTIIGQASKKDSHVFSKEQPTGVLHRAFSVFLFDKSDGRLLLQKRAASKITFPNVWTNTCCSHPLNGMEPSEVDTPQDVKKGSVMGVKYAAIRKLEHELGIPKNQLDVNKFEFITRLHYWAADTVTHGPQAPWGEHEIDYVLLYAVDSKEQLTVQGHPDEIDDYKWVSLEELQQMLADKALLFSPWFRIIVQKWLTTWWKDLDTCLTTNKYRDYDSIHEFDPPVEHLGGAGNAQPLFTQGDVSKKQGAYGKITIHKEPKMTQIMHIDEVLAALTFLYISPLKSNLKTNYIQRTFDKDDLAFCDEILVKVSRSFAAVIRQLPANLLVDILIFYLVLRALDTIEDDTSAFPSHEVKIQHLLNFHKQALQDPNWTMDGVGAGDERRLLQEFPKCQRVYASLSPQSRRIIADITHRMATGMAEFVGKDLGQGTTDIEQYNRYCHFVAGLVGEGLSGLFAASGLEQASLAKEVRLSDQMGLFLQKTNIIRDYLEDYVDKRAFWPQSIWKKYSATGELGYFVNQNDPEVKKQSLACLNELVTDALELVPDCLSYMSNLHCAEVFRFCAIPQVMAIATLDKCFANADVFTGVVKIRKGLSCKLLLRTNNLVEVHETFYQFSKSILAKANSERQKGSIDPSYERTVRACQTILDLTNSAAKSQFRRRLARRVTTGSLLVAAAYIPSDNKWVRPALVATAALVYWLGPWSPISNLQDAEKIQKIDEIKQV